MTKQNNREAELQKELEEGKVIHPKTGKYLGLTESGQLAEAELKGIQSQKAKDKKEELEFLLKHRREIEVLYAREKVPTCEYIEEFLLTPIDERIKQIKDNLSKELLGELDK